MVWRVWRAAVGKELIPEHHEYFCDFCQGDVQYMKAGDLHGIKLSDSGAYPLPVSPINPNAQMHVCDKCVRQWGALFHQIMVNQEKAAKAKEPAEEKLELKRPILKRKGG